MQINLIKAKTTREEVLNVDLIFKIDEFGNVVDGGDTLTFQELYDNIYAVHKKEQETESIDNGLVNAEGEFV